MKEMGEEGLKSKSRIASSSKAEVDEPDEEQQSAARIREDQAAIR